MTDSQIFIFILDANLIYVHYIAHRNLLESKKTNLSWGMLYFEKDFCHLNGNDNCLLILNLFFDNRFSVLRIKNAMNMKIAAFAEY